MEEGVQRKRSAWAKLSVRQKEVCFVSFTVVGTLVFSAILPIETINTGLLFMISWLSRQGLESTAWSTGVNICDVDP